MALTDETHLFTVLYSVFLFAEDTSRDFINAAEICKLGVSPETSGVSALGVCGD